MSIIGLLCLLDYESEECFIAILAGYAELAEKEGFWMEFKFTRSEESKAAAQVASIRDEWVKSLDESGGQLKLTRRYGHGVA